MNRVRISFFGLLALFFLSINNPSIAATPGDWYFYHTSDSNISNHTGEAVNGVTTTTQGNYNPYPVTHRTSLNRVDAKYFGVIAIAMCSFNSSTKKYEWASYVTSNDGLWTYGAAGIALSKPQLSSRYAIPSESCVAPICDTHDDDNDGVCNTCDKLPGQPDKKHCIWNQSYTVDGQIGFMEIDQSGNCDGSSTVSRKNSQLDSQTQYFDISKNHEEITAPTCAGDDGTGACKCDYNSSVPSTLSPTSETVDPKTKEELEKLPDDSNCAEIKAACESACLKYGGTKTNSCTSSGDSNHSSCACMDSTTINTITNNTTNNSQTTQGNVSSTGGSDNNNDGKDDVYSAVKDAIADSGLGSKINSTNSLLNGIGNTLDSISDSLKNGQTSGDAPLPNKNTYDDTVKELAEQPFGDAIKDFMVSGLPLIDFIRGTGINNGSGESSLTFNVFGSDLELDFAPYSDLLEWVGLVLVFIASIIAFMIITNS